MKTLFHSRVFRSVAALLALALLPAISLPCGTGSADRAITTALAPLAAQEAVQVQQDTPDSLFGGYDDDADFFFGGSNSDDELFGGFGGDDDFFLDDGNDGFVVIENSSDSATSALRAGTIFQTGSVRIGGSFDMGASTRTQFLKDKKFWDCVSDTTLTSRANVTLTLDARPTSNLRLYAKGGIDLPYTTQSQASLLQTPFGAAGSMLMGTGSGTVFQNLFYAKEVFTDFSFTPTINARFGKQTLTWGVGYFFSPASNIVNLSSIDPQNTDVQVEGPLALRTSFMFPGTQNTVYAYVIPDTTLTRTTTPTPTNPTGTTAITGSPTSFVKDTAVAAKGELVLGNYEMGLGAWYKRNREPKLMATVTGPFTRYGSFFAEGVASWGTSSEWAESKEFSGKTPTFQATVGTMFNWSNPGITLMAQYYYNGDNSEKTTITSSGLPSFSTQGNNLALSVSFSKLGLKNVSASLFGMAYLDSEYILAQGTVSYKPFNEFSASLSPIMLVTSYKERPLFAVQLSARLGGGNF